MLDLDDEAALKALQEKVALPFLIRVRIYVFLTPHWASALSNIRLRSVRWIWWIERCSR
jgi:hypothetical protein